jgi:nicotinamidase/pyrazinamidase
MLPFCSGVFVAKPANGCGRIGDQRRRQLNTTVAPIGAHLNRRNAVRKVHLVCIDAQNDFCSPQGSLFVKGGDANVARTAKMIERLVDKLSDITVTMDSHRKIDISHPMWFVDEHGKHPNPFTMISVADLESGKWRTTQRSAQARTLAYLKALTAGGRYPHVIWPEHCLIGDEGHNLHPTLSAALHQWEQKRYAMCNVVTKGSNPYTEHFSAVAAEVPDPEDPSTQVNRAFVESLENDDIILLAGEALSHCLANTVRDVGSNFSDPKYIEKLVLLTDATSPVPTFEHYGDAFIKEMVAKGMKLSTTTDILS